MRSVTAKTGPSLSGLEPKYVFEENQVQVTWKTEKGIRFPYVSGTLVHPKAYVERPTTHILMNTSEIDAKWCFPILRKYIHATDRVCVFALAFLMTPKIVRTGINNMRRVRGFGIARIQMYFSSMA